MAEAGDAVDDLRGGGGVVVGHVAHVDGEGEVDARGTATALAGRTRLVDPLIDGITVIFTVLVNG